MEVQQGLEGVAVAVGVEVVGRTLVQGTVAVLAPPPRLASAALACPHLKVTDVTECLNLLGYILGPPRPPSVGPAQGTVRCCIC